MLIRDRINKTKMKLITAHNELSCAIFMGDEYDEEIAKMDISICKLEISILEGMKQRGKITF